jgi:hypothetical protein
MDFPVFAQATIRTYLPASMEYGIAAFVRQLLICCELALRPNYANASVGVTFFDEKQLKFYLLNICGNRPDTVPSSSLSGARFRTPTESGRRYVVVN